MVKAAENNSDPSYSLQLSVMFILFTKTKGSWGTQGHRRGRRIAKSPRHVCGCWSARLTVYERLSYGAAVCSEWTSCSLLIQVSPCPPSSRALPRRKAATKPSFKRGSIQRWPTGCRITGESICSNQGRRVRLHQSISSGHGLPPLNLKPCPAWPGTASLRVAPGPPGTCWWAWCPSLDALLEACWQSIGGEHRGARWSNVARHLWRSRGSEGWRVMDAPTLFVSECKDRCTQTEHKDIMGQLSAVS